MPQGWEAHYAAERLGGVQGGAIAPLVGGAGGEGAPAKFLYFYNYIIVLKIAQKRNIRPTPASLINDDGVTKPLYQLIYKAA